MNEFEVISAAQIERLVDGELSSAERRQILMGLDRDAGGWRQLALAFLESQAIRESLQRTAPLPTDAAGGRAVHDVLETPALREMPLPGRRALRWRPVLTMAICGLLLFGLGRWSKPVVNESVTTKSQATPAPKTYSSFQASPDRGHGAETLVADSAAAAVQQQQTLRLELEESPGGASQSVEVPVVENSSIRAEDLMLAPPLISEEVQRALLRSGRRVYEQRQLYEVMLEDGRRGVVPISDVFVENAGWDAYQ